MTYLYRIVALLIAITVHEFSHGKVADMLGDPTARKSGRLSLNPIRHLDPIGSLMIILVGFGWAKPVPVNPSNFQNPQRGMLYVGLAGPLANFTTAFLFGLPIKMGLVPHQTVISGVILTIVWINTALGVFNLLPIPPLDGSNVLAAFLPRSALRTYWAWERYGILILFLLIVVFDGIFISGILFPMVNFLLSFFL